MDAAETAWQGGPIVAYAHGELSGPSEDLTKEKLIEILALYSRVRKDENSTYVPEDIKIQAV